MKGYEYPRVHPPTSLLPPQQPADSRFSWMDTSVEQEDRVGAARDANTMAPQQAPSQQDPTHGQVQTDSMEPQEYSDGMAPYQRQDPAVAQHRYPPAPHQYGLFPAQPSSPMPVPVQPPRIHSPQHPIPPMPLPPEPLKHPTIPENEPTGPIAPDTNPLTPTALKRPNRTSTNMAIVPPPTDPAQFSAHTFTPSPQSIKGGSWQHGLCSCAEPSICMTGLFCPCIVYGKTQYRLSLRDEKRDPTNMLGYTAVNGSCIAFGLLCGVNGFLAAVQRTRLRKKYAMSSEAGDVAGDCLKGVCCCCCVVAQDEKEVKFREEAARKPAGSGTKKEGYVAPTTMTFSPPPR